METVKKLTKKEREELERSLRQKRTDFINAVEGYWKDYNNAEDYLATKGERVSEEENERLFRRYEALNDYKLKYDDNSKDERMWSVIRFIVRGTKRRSYGDPVDKHLTTKLSEDDLLIDDTIWSTDELLLLFSEAKKYGYKRIFYMNNGSSALGTVSEAIELGAKVEGTTYNVEYSRFGLILNIEEVRTEIEPAQDEVLLNDLRKQFSELEENVKYDWCRRDIEGKILKEYSDSLGLEEVYATIQIVRKEYIDKYENKEEK